MVICCLKKLINESHSFLPVFFGGICSVKLLEFRIVGDKVFLGYGFMKDRLFKLIVLYFNP